VARLLRTFLISTTLVGALVVPPSYAGSGTAQDPWKTLNIWDTWSNASGPTRAAQVIRATQINANALAFWAFSPVLHSTATGDTSIYVGFQTQGLLKGSQNNVVVPKSAHFSIFGHVGQPIHNLQPTQCSNGADGGAGISCAKQFGWVANNSYSVYTDYFYGITTPGWCPPTVSPCTVAVGGIGSTQIGAFSYSPLAYGSVTGTSSSFLEMPLFIGGTCADPVPIGQFTIPYKVVSGNQLYVSSASSFDRNDTVYPQTCARTWNDWLATWISY
jgi:hypothetical protein